MVNLICLNSSRVLSFSKTKIRVPSERTTCSRGESRKANGILVVVLLVTDTLKVKNHVTHAKHWMTIKTM